MRRLVLHLQWGLAENATPFFFSHIPVNLGLFGASWFIVSRFQRRPLVPRGPKGLFFSFPRGRFDWFMLPDWLLQHPLNTRVLRAVAVGTFQQTCTGETSIIGQN